MLNLGHQSNKDTLAKLMATEDITVIHKKVPTAYFDVKSRTLCVPILKEDMSPELRDLFAGHEVGHALYTPVDGWHDSVCEKGSMFKGYLNVIEDCRIEEMVKSKYPGLRRSFYKGYEELANDNFFGTHGQDLSKLNLIDKINIHFKIGAQARVQFSNEELPYIERCKNLKTFEEVMELASELFEHQKEKTDEELESMTQEQLEQLIEELGLNPEDFESSEDGEDGGATITIEMPDGQGEGEGSGNEDGESESEPTNGQGAGRSIKDQIKEQLNKSETDEEFRKNESRTHNNMDGNSHNPDYVELKDKVKYENYIVPWKEIDHLMAAPEPYSSKILDRGPIQNTVKEFVNSNKKIVSYMVKEFEMKKAAADYKRSMTAKTGEINMDRLHLYQLKDDIFNRVQVIPEGKNHGIVMLVDWSGSMTGTVKGTIEQATLLSMFCRRLQIPFRLFAFSDCYRAYTTESDERPEPQQRMYGKHTDEVRGVRSWSVPEVSLLEIFNEKMSNAEFTRSMENWFQLAYSNDGSRSHHAYSSYDSRWYTPHGLSLSGTPLDASLIVIRDFLVDFKQDYNLDITSLVALTDGDSHRAFNSWYTKLVDRKRNRVFDLTETDGSRGYAHTAGLLSWIKETTGARTIGFFLTKASGGNFWHEASRFCNPDNNVDWDEKRKEYNKLAATFTEGTYDLSIIINQRKIDIDYEKDNLNVEVGATKGKLKNALVKAGNNKMKQRVILNKFVGQMAV